MKRFQPYIRLLQLAYDILRGGFSGRRLVNISRDCKTFCSQFDKEEGELENFCELLRNQLLLASFYILFPLLTCP